MAFGKKFAVQFHQLIVKAKITSKFASQTPFAIRQICLPKKASYSARRKSQEEMLMELTPVGIIF